MNGLGIRLKQAGPRPTQGSAVGATWTPLGSLSAGVIVLLTRGVAVAAKHRLVGRLHSVELIIVCGARARQGWELL